MTAQHAADGQPWPLHAATLRYYKTDLFDADGIATPAGPPIVHYAPEVNVDIWAPEEVEN
jgi:uncharacterized protein YqjF (DUF2071 family)